MCPFFMTEAGFPGPRVVMARQTRKWSFFEFFHNKKFVNLQILLLNKIELIVSFPTVPGLSGLDRWFAGY